MATEKRPVRAVIFDLDGTLVDSEPVYLMADQHMFGKYGLQINEEFKRKYVGRATKVMLGDLKEQYGFTQTVEELVAQKNQLYLQLAREHTVVFLEMAYLVQGLQTAGYRLAVASGSSPEVIEATLEIAGLRSCFEVVVSAVQVVHGKPAPDVFLAAAQQLGVAAAECMVVEDSHFGVRAAVTAGMRCIAVPPVYEALHPDFSSAQLLFAGGMPAFRAQAVWDWLEGC